MVEAILEGHSGNVGDRRMENLQDKPLVVLCRLYSQSHNEYEQKKDDLEYAQQGFDEAYNDLVAIEKAIKERAKEI